MLYAQTRNHRKNATKSPRDFKIQIDPQIRTRKSNLELINKKKTKKLLTKKNCPANRPQGEMFFKKSKKTEKYQDLARKLKGRGA